jgi:hypothetical protein
MLLFVENERFSEKYATFDQMPPLRQRYFYPKNLKAEKRELPDKNQRVCDANLTFA